MLLANFEIISDIELRSSGVIWELHNFANFEGVEFQRSENAAVMAWSAPKNSNPWGDTANKASGMKLRFSGLRTLTIGPRDPEMPMTEDECLAAILRASTSKGEDFRLLFDFQSGRRIEIEAESVELIAIP